MKEQEKFYHVITLVPYKGGELRTELNLTRNEFVCKLIDNHYDSVYDLIHNNPNICEDDVIDAIAGIDIDRDPFTSDVYHTYYVTIDNELQPIYSDVDYWEDIYHKIVETA